MTWADGLVDVEKTDEGHPAPEVTARPARPEELPGGAKVILKAATKAGGWFTFATYARGTKPTRTRPVVDSILVKGVRFPQAFVVQYLDGKVESAYLSRFDGAGFRRASISELKDYLR